MKEILPDLQTQPEKSNRKGKFHRALMHVFSSLAAVHLRMSTKNGVSSSFIEAPIAQTAQLQQGVEARHMVKQEVLPLTNHVMMKED